MTKATATWTVLAGIAGLLAFEWYLGRAAPQVPFMDSMRYIWQLDEILRGQLSWREAWYGGEHRGLLFPLVHLIEWLGWGLDAKVSTRLIGVVVLATLALWLQQWAKQVSVAAGDAMGGVGRWILYLVPPTAALLAFSPAGFELWLLNLGLGGLLKNFFVVGFLVLWAREIECAPGEDSRPWLGLLGGVLVLTATYGWSYALTLAALSALMATRAWSPRALRHRLTLAVPLLGAQLVYVLAGSGVLTRGSSILDAGGLPALLQGMLLGAGSVLIDYETALHHGLSNAGLMLAGLIPLAAFTIQLLRIGVDGIDAARRFQLSIAVFSLGNLGAAAFSRCGVAIEAATASRYFVDYQWLILGTLALACDRRRLGQPLFSGGRWLALSPRLEKLNRGILLVLIIAIVAGHAATWNFEFRIAGSRAEYFQKMRSVYLEGVRSEQDAQVLQAPLADAKRGVDVARKYALGPFRALRASCALEKANFQGAWFHAGLRDQRWLGKQGAVLLSGCGSRVTLDVYLPPAFAPRTLMASTILGHLEFALKPGEIVSVELDVVPDQQPFRVELQVDDVTVPRAAEGGSDDRPLGALLTRIRTSSAP